MAGAAIDAETVTRERLFPSAGWQKFFLLYSRLFSIQEIANDKIIQIALGALLLSLFVTFFSWVNSGSIAVSSYLSSAHTCWPYFQNCGVLYFLEPLPLGYSQTMFYAGIFTVMLGIVFLMYKKEWVLAHILLSLLWLWKFLALFVLTQDFAGNYDYYDTILLFVILFLPYKLFFAKLVFVWLYFLASTIKIHEGWILGTYFTTLQTGLPIFGNTIAPLITGIVIFMQTVGAWFLLSSRTTLRYIAFSYFFLFHLFAAILVGYRYTTISLAMLVILFGLSQITPRVPLTRRSLPGWAFLVILLAIQLTPIVLIAGDQKMTLEGNKYGLYMFEANHQCVSNATVYFTDGTSQDIERTSVSARNRCDPYRFWFSFHNQCERDEAVDRITWTFDHSINGNPFYRIVDVPDACALEYRAFRHNDWIKLPKDEPAIVGYPLKNYYW